MTFARLPAYLVLAGAAAAFSARADEVNYWPAYVGQKDISGQTPSWEAAGPLFFSNPNPVPDPGHASGFRPFYVEVTNADSERFDILYPLFYYRKYSGSYKWSILELINDEGVPSGVTKSGGPEDKHFDIWPVYFSHETGDPIDSYHAVFPVFGTIKYRLGFDRLTWAPFPLYVQATKKGTRTTYLPWPIIRSISGETNGFAVWPLFGVSKGPGVARNTFFLWPLIWDNTLEPKPDAPEGTPPGTEVGFLPFYTRDESPGKRSENYLWPFFGYTEQTSPFRYSERRYLWPFLVQGRGDDRVVNRWGPFYTHSNVKGADSRWILWPLWHRTSQVDDDIAQSKTSFFYFLYWCLDEASVSHPRAPHASKTHVWPLISIWDNGAGSRQVQFPSPLEVFFPDNPDMRQVWTPLFSLYRYDHRPTGESRTSLLWSAVTWRRDASGALAEFHLGPLVGMNRGGWSILGFDLTGNREHPSQANR